MKSRGQLLIVFPIWPRSSESLLSGSKIRKQTRGENASRDSFPLEKVIVLNPL